MNLNLQQVPVLTPADHDRLLEEEDVCRLELGAAGLLPHEGLAPLQRAAARTALAATSIAPPQEVSLQQCSAVVSAEVRAEANLQQCCAVVVRAVYCRTKF